MRIEVRTEPDQGCLVVRGDLQSTHSRVHTRVTKTRPPWPRP